MPIKKSKLVVNDIVESYRLTDYMKAHEEDSTADVIESKVSVTTWQRFFTKENIPWVTTLKDGLYTIWKVIDKSILEEEPIHFKPLMDMSRKRHFKKPSRS